MVVGRIFMINKFTTSMGMQVITHVITLHLHVVAHLVKTRGTDHVALTIDLPSYGAVCRAHFVGARVTRGGTCVVGHILAHLSVHNHTADHIRIEVRVIIHNGKDLPMHSNSRSNVLRLEGRKGFHRKIAENTIVEGGLELVHCSTRSHSRVGPVHLICLTDFHSHTVLPFIRGSELGISLIVVVATESILHFTFRKSTFTVSPVRTSHISMGSIAALIIFANRVMLCSQMPMHIHRAHARLPVLLGLGG
mmetsp:Transcript_11630/g.24896  ORF Transcript_11630/g.24896 Transcript_11630/m.24896 type:complete len:250 (-) Transcript_11630:349-1098(-)